MKFRFSVWIVSQETPAAFAAFAAVALVVVTDVTWDGTSLHVSFGWPGRKPLASFVFP